jgi:hypothetical protein
MMLRMINKTRLNKLEQQGMSEHLSTFVLYNAPMIEFCDGRNWDESKQMILLTQAMALYTKWMLMDYYMLIRKL